PEGREEAEAVVAIRAGRVPDLASEVAPHLVAELLPDLFAQLPDVSAVPLRDVDDARLDRAEVAKDAGVGESQLPADAAPLEQLHRSVDHHQVPVDLAADPCRTVDDHDRARGGLAG